MDYFSSELPLPTWVRYFLPDVLTNILILQKADSKCERILNKMKPKCSSYWACPDSQNAWYRWQQTIFILNTIKYTTPYMFGPDTDFVIVGGDFNETPEPGNGWESK